MFKSAPRLPARATQGGFTLIELVVVIVILGILAAFAVPRFARLDQQARIASVRSLEGTIRSASAMTHGMWMAVGTNPATVAVESGTVAMTAAGYPTAAAAGIQATLAPNTVQANVPGKFVTAAGAAANTWTFSINGAPNAGANCRVTYTAPTAVNTMPGYAVDVTSC